MCRWSGGLAARFSASRRITCAPETPRFLAVTRNARSLFTPRENFRFPDPFPGSILMIRDLLVNCLNNLNLSVPLVGVEPTWT